MLRSIFHRLIFFFGLLLLCSILGAEEKDSRSTDARPVLFLTSNPINADVLVDGEPLEQQTPLLLKDLEPGVYGLEIRKEGCTPRSLEIELEAGKVETVSLDFSTQCFSPSFPEEKSLSIRGQEEQAGENLFELPQGTYTIQRREEILHIEPVFAQDGWIKGLNLALPLAAAFSTVLTVHDIFYPKRAALQISPSFSLSPATLSAYGITLTLLGFDVALGVRRAKSKKAFAYRSTPHEQSLHNAAAYYERGEKLFALGQLAEALQFYTDVLEGYRDSVLYPQALFKTARIHFLTGEDSLAVIELNLIVDRYPLPDLYDKARRKLADILLRQGRYRQSIEQLRSMVFADPLYVPEEIEALQAEVFEAWYSEEETVLNDLIASYQLLISRYPTSENVDLYRYKTAFYLHLARRESEARELLDRIDLSQVDEELEQQVRELRSSIGPGE